MPAGPPHADSPRFLGKNSRVRTQAEPVEAGGWTASPAPAGRRLARTPGSPAGSASGPGIRSARRTCGAQKRSTFHRVRVRDLTITSAPKRREGAALMMIFKQRPWANAARRPRGRLNIGGFTRSHVPVPGKIKKKNRPQPASWHGRGNPPRTGFEGGYMFRQSRLLSGPGLFGDTPGQ